MNEKGSFWNELKERNVVKAAISYVVVSWLIIRIVSLLGDILEAPLWVSKGLFFLLLIGFPICLILAWIYELTPNGIKRTSKVSESASFRAKTGKKYNKIIIICLSLTLIVLLIDRFVISTKHVPVEEMAYITPITSESIAVLPFDDFSEKKDNEYFADGLTEELLSLMAHITGLKVTSRTSAFAFKNTDLDIPTIAERLQVKYILEGSVRKSGNQIRITAQLIEAKTDKHLWSETYDRTLDNIFLVQDEVAKAVVNALSLNLLQKKELPKTRKTDPEAYSDYLKAIHAFRKSANPEQLKNSETYAKKTLALDNKYTPAWLLLAKIYQIQANNSSRTYDEGYSLAIDAVEKVIEIDPSNALAYAYLADIEWSYNWNFTKAKNLNASALKLDSSNPEIINLSSIIATGLGNIESAVRLSEYSVSLDPVNPDSYYNISNVYYYADRLEDAEAAAKKCIELQPNRWAIHYYHARILLQQGKVDEALAAIELEEDRGWRLHIFTEIYFRKGELQKSNAYLLDLITEYQDEMAYQIAESYAIMGDENKAFEWLEKAYQLRDVGLNEVLAEPRFRKLHNDPRWTQLIDKLNFPNQVTEQNL